METYHVEVIQKSGVHTFWPEHGNFMFYFRTEEDATEFSISLKTAPETPIRYEVHWKKNSIDRSFDATAKESCSKEFTFSISEMSHQLGYVELGPTSYFMVIVKPLDLPRPSPPKGQFFNNFYKLLCDDQLKDVTFKIGSEEIKAHKLILATRSPVFKTMFQADMEEKATNVIELKDTSLDAFKAFLEFIYCDKYSATQLSDELLYLGEKYDVSDLKIRTSQHLLETINVENAIETLVHCHLHRISELKRRVAKFIAQNKSEAYPLNKQDELKKQYPELAEYVDTAIEMVME